MDRQRLGIYGEEIAAGYLLEQGYRVLARRWRCSRGEIDIVAQEGDCLAFVEVKTRRGHAFTRPEDGLTQAKARRLQQLGMCYLAEEGLDDAMWRIDLVAVEVDGAGRVLRRELYRCAVTG